MPEPVRPDPEADEDDEEVGTFTLEDWATCPKCRKPMTKEAVVCLECG